MNTLFAPYDSMNQNVNDSICTFHHLEFLLWKCSEPALRSIINRLNKKQTSCDYFDSSGYFEIMLPAVNFLDANLVEEICIDTRTHTLTEDEKRAFDQFGIKVTNNNSPKYVPETDKLIQAITDNRFDDFKNLFTPEAASKNLDKLLKKAVALGRTSFIDHIYQLKEGKEDEVVILNRIVFFSIEFNQMDIFKTYIEKEKCFHDGNNGTLLEYALAYDRVDMGQLLLDKKAGFSFNNMQNLSVFDRIIKKYPHLLDIAIRYVAFAPTEEKHKDFVHSLMKERKRIYRKLVQHGTEEGLNAFFLLELERKRDEFVKRKYTNAAQDATSLLDTLKASYAEYQEKSRQSPTDKQRYWNDMKQSWYQEVTQASEKTSLKKHRGFKNLLVHFSLFLLTAGVGSAIAAGYTLYRSKGKQIFFQTNTDTRNMLDKWSNKGLKPSG